MANDHFDPRSILSTGYLRVRSSGPAPAERTIADGWEGDPRYPGGPGSSALPSPSEIWTGARLFDLGAPQAFLIDSISDIATTLSRLCRFGGRGLPRFYSVAEHSILCDQIARDKGVPQVYRRTILMHDAAEAYIGDIVSPLKGMLRPADIEGIENRILSAIFERFEILPGFSWKEIDLAAFAVEKRDLYPSAPSWGEPTPGPWSAPVYGSNMDGAALEFVKRADALGIR